jgi:dipicolinate synthase subunit A
MEELISSLSKKERVYPLLLPDDLNKSESPVVILPFFIKDEKVAELLAYAKRGTRVFGGHIGEETNRVAEERSLDYTDILEEEGFCRDNALITAEGALSLIINSTDETLYSMRVAVLGYGRIGERLTRMLLSLGATVRVFSSNSEELSRAKTRGISACHLWQRDNMDIFRAVVNTVPLRHVIDEDTLYSLSDAAYILDLASGENNVNWRVMNSLMLKGEKASSLPQKVSPKSAALAVERAIFRHLN